MAGCNHSNVAAQRKAPRGKLTHLEKSVLSWPATWGTCTHRNTWRFVEQGSVPHSGLQRICRWHAHRGAAVNHSPAQLGTTGQLGTAGQRPEASPNDGHSAGREGRLRQVGRPLLAAGRPHTNGWVAIAVVTRILRRCRCRNMAGAYKNHQLGGGWSAEHAHARHRHQLSDHAAAVFHPLRLDHPAATPASHTTQSFQPLTLPRCKKMYLR